MPFKVHLLIVSVIIIAVYLGWQITAARTPATIHATQNASKQLIAVVHASWGMNCPHAVGAADGNVSATNDAYARKGDENKLHDDNVLSVVAKLCNGKASCEFDVDTSTLGDNPAADCNPKSFDVEYRCFSYDRPRTVSSMSKTVTISCNPE